LEGRGRVGGVNWCVSGGGEGADICFLLIVKPKFGTKGFQEFGTKGYDFFLNRIDETQNASFAREKRKMHKNTKNKLLVQFTPI